MRSTATGDSIPLAYISPFRSHSYRHQAKTRFNPSLLRPSQPLIIPISSYPWLLDAQIWGLSLYHNCDSTAIRLRHDYDEKLTCSFLLASNRVEWKTGARDTSYSRILVVSQSNRNFDHFRRSRMRRGIVVYDVS